MEALAKQTIFTEQGGEDFEWLIAHSQELVEKYPDSWIAVYQGEVVGVGTSAAEAVRLAQTAKGPDCWPVVRFVEGGAYVY